MLKKILIAFVALIAIIVAGLIVFQKIYFHKTDLPLLTQKSLKKSPILIQNAMLFTGNPEEGVMGNVNILINHARIIDAKGKMVIPGLIDAHTHILGAAAPSSLPCIPNPKRNMSAYLYAGITTVIDMGGSLRDLDGFSSALEKANIAAPRLYYAGKLLIKKGGHPAPMIKLLSFWPISSLVISSMTYEIEPGADIEKMIQENTDHGARMVKVVVDDIPFGIPVLDTEELKRIVGIANKKQLPVMAHIGTEEDIVCALKAGIKYFVHAPNLSSISEATIQKMKRQGAVVTPTVAVYDNIALLGKKQLKFSGVDKDIVDPVIVKEYMKDQSEYTPKSLMEWVRGVIKYQDIKFDNIKKLKRAGIPLIAATDSPNVATFPGSSMHRELEMLVTRCGFTPLEAVAAATYVPAKYYSSVLGKEGLGHIAEGAPADVVILNGDFRNDIRQTTNIDTVIMGGNIIHRMKLSSEKQN
jgi:imidazolonepropionase-like amidohydrolase